MHTESQQYAVIVREQSVEQCSIEHFIVLFHRTANEVTIVVPSARLAAVGSVQFGYMMLRTELRMGGLKPIQFLLLMGIAQNRLEFDHRSFRFRVIGGPSGDSSSWRSETPPSA